MPQSVKMTTCKADNDEILIKMMAFPFAVSVIFPSDVYNRHHIRHPYIKSDLERKTELMISINVWLISDRSLSQWKKTFYM